ncbi:MAG: VTT domain-containing protein [Lacticaseibacillus songhuajiangensis]|jgi:uncharacterized membrane protein YdjX (TVP38/TMEM64 family)|nr:VTT domain-containing protein [Lacticaseibacillus songhuajiangensis]
MTKLDAQTHDLKLTKRVRMIIALIVLVIAGTLLFFGLRHNDQVRALLELVGDYRHYLLGIRHLGAFAFIAFGLVLIVVTLIPGAPSSVVAILIGVCLGHWLGFAVDAVGLTVGNLIQSHMFHRIESKHQNELQSRIYAYLIKMHRPELGMVVGYALPMIPTAFINMAASTLRMDPKKHIASCAVGSSIAGFLYAFGGDLVVTTTAWKSLLVLLTVAAIFGLAELGVRIRRRRLQAES